MSDIHMSLRLSCHADIFKNIDSRYCEDWIKVMSGFGETQRGLFRKLIEEGNGKELIEFMTTEMSHYRDNRGNG